MEVQVENFQTEELSGDFIQTEELSKDSRKFYCIVKRLFDICVSFISLFILSPFMVILGLLIVWDDPHGSPVFHQKRVGKNGKIFRFYKFRSMVVNAEALLDRLQDKNEKDGPVFKMKNDPRITRMGKWLRRTSLDELPQLWNVLIGDMSLVGPRPPLPKEAEQYNDYQKQRLSVTPGLTCYWQVQKHRDSVSFQEWVDLDIKYIRERSILVDLKILFRTVLVVFTGQGE